MQNQSCLVRTGLGNYCSTCRTAGGWADCAMLSGMIGDKDQVKGAAIGAWVRAGRQAGPARGARSPAGSRGFTWVEALIVIVIGLILAAMLIPAWQGYRYRSLITDAVIEAGVHGKGFITEFHDRHRRLPTAAEGARLVDPALLEGSKSLQWDAARQLLIVTPRHEVFGDRRFAYKVEVTPQGLEWRCGMLELEAKYLPAMCRVDSFAASR